MNRNISGFFLAVMILAPGLCQGGAVHQFAVIFPGIIQDRDYNMAGHLALKHAGDLFGIETAFTQQVGVENAEAVIKGHVTNGFNIIWTHGGQYTGLITQICSQFPDTVFIVEGDEPMDTEYPNVIVIGGRNYHKSYYVLGALAARLTRTGHVGYLGGIELPFTYGEINAAGTAMREYRKELKLHHLYAGDFNDPLKARMAADALIDLGCDVILSGVNLGNFGLFEALKTAPRRVFFTTAYTSKKGYAPENYLCSDRVNYIPPIEAILKDVLEKGTRSGYYPVTWGEGYARYISFPIHNVPEDLNREVEQIAREVARGTIQVPKILDRIVIVN